MPTVGSSVPPVAARGSRYAPGELPLGTNKAAGCSLAWFWGRGVASVYEFLICHIRRATLVEWNPTNAQPD